MSDIRSGREWAWFVRRALALLVGATFVYAGALKIWDPLTFATDISNYQILPWPISVRIAFYLPWLEVLCGLALIFHRLLAGALFLTGGLMLVFIAAMVAARARGINIDCGCFGVASGNLSFTWHLVLDLALLAIVVLLWFWPRPSPATA
ncbi:MAG: DoxX family protein [Chthoniobacterales bacterium]|nr:DoxX family protein [Chthoniobacterales bacterium]